MLTFGAFEGRRKNPVVIAIFGRLLYLGSYLASSCTIGFAGNAASVTVNGTDAAGWCNQQIRGTSNLYAADERKNRSF